MEKHSKARLHSIKINSKGIMVMMMMRRHQLITTSYCKNKHQQIFLALATWKKRYDDKNEQITNNYHGYTTYTQASHGFSGKSVIANQSSNKCIRIKTYKRKPNNNYREFLRLAGNSQTKQKHGGFAISAELLLLRLRFFELRKQLFQRWCWGRYIFQGYDVIGSFFPANPAPNRSARAHKELFHGHS